MTVQEALTKLKVTLGLDTEVVETVETTEVEETVVEASEEETTEETIETQFAEETLVDGTVVKVEGELEVGKQLVVVTEEGDVAAPEGMHQTESGKLITVDAEGVITSIEEADAEEVTEEAAPEEAASQDFSEVVDSITEVVKPALDRINEVAAELEALKASFSAFKDEPAATKITNNLQEFKAAAKSAEESRFEALKRIRNEK